MPLGRFSEKIFPGARFNKLVVVERIAGGKGKRAKIHCRCDCGKETLVDCSNLSNNNTKSCGCLNHRKTKQRAREKSVRSSRCSLIVPGAVFSRLTVIHRIEIDGKLTNKVKCKCSCGKECLREIAGVVYGKSRSCGCLASELTAERNRKSGRFGGFSGKYPRTWKSWDSMMGRCLRTGDSTYPKYGAIGIRICEYLQKTPQNLMRIIGVRKKTAPSLDRFPIHDGNYTCGQCSECKRNGWELNIRWATRKQQSENRGAFNVHLTAFGKTLLKSQWMELSGLSWGRITKRLRYGWSMERTLTTPDSFGNCYKP